ncbi:hypothetical protein SO802_028119 [Lithocarpus litseifolius]|uniref:Uncharacterized protein n=1 Tax=Lithocarpus litseifolius TaxID=425828 RepID=A0AAW2BSK2_9ROSI
MPNTSMPNSHIQSTLRRDRRFPCLDRRLTTARSGLEPKETSRSWEVMSSSSVHGQAVPAGP